MRKCITITNYRQRVLINRNIYGLTGEQKAEAMTQGITGLGLSSAKIILVFGEGNVRSVRITLYSSFSTLVSFIERVWSKSRNMTDDS